jgi:hypothetical protein
VLADVAVQSAAELLGVVDAEVNRVSGSIESKLGLVGASAINIVLEIPGSSDLSA